MLQINRSQSASELNLCPRSWFPVKRSGRTPKAEPEQLPGPGCIPARGSHGQWFRVCSVRSIPSGAAPKQKLFTKVGQTRLGTQRKTSHNDFVWSQRQVYGHYEGTTSSRQWQLPTKPDLWLLSCRKALRGKQSSLKSLKSIQVRGKGKEEKKRNLSSSFITEVLIITALKGLFIIQVCAFTIHTETGTAINLHLFQNLEEIKWNNATHADSDSDLLAA